MLQYGSAPWITPDQPAGTQMAARATSTQGLITRKTALNHKYHRMSSDISKKTINIQIVNMEEINPERSASAVF
jgi:hypothetical protein